MSSLPYYYCAFHPVLPASPPSKSTSIVVRNGLNPLRPCFGLFLSPLYGFAQFGNVFPAIGRSHPTFCHAMQYNAAVLEHHTRDYCSSSPSSGWGMFGAALASAIGTMIGAMWSSFTFSDMMHTTFLSGEVHQQHEMACNIGYMCRLGSSAFCARQLPVWWTSAIRYSFVSERWCGSFQHCLLFLSDYIYGL